MNKGLNFLKKIMEWFLILGTIITSTPINFYKLNLKLYFLI